MTPTRSLFVFSFVFFVVFALGPLVSRADVQVKCHNQYVVPSDMGNVTPIRFVLNHNMGDLEIDTNMYEPFFVAIRLDRSQVMVIGPLYNPKSGNLHVMLASMASGFHKLSIAFGETRSRAVYSLSTGYLNVDTCFSVPGTTIVTRWTEFL